LKTFLEEILGKPFQLFRRIVNDVRKITKHRPSMLVSVEETGTHQLQPSQESMGDTSV
jgi:hypothetical protein